MLVSVTFYMLLSPHFAIAKKEWELCIKSEFERMADLSFLEILEKHKDTMLTKEMLAIEHSLDEIPLFISDKQLSIKRIYSFVFANDKEKGIHRPLDVYVELETGLKVKKKYKYGVVLECISAV